LNRSRGCTAGGRVRPDVTLTGARGFIARVRVARQVIGRLVDTCHGSVLLQVVTFQLDGHLLGRWPADVYNRKAPARRTRSKISPTNTAVHATSAIYKKAGGKNSRNVNPIASLIRSVLTAYMPSGKTAPQ
jgi:hypothetical protein